MLRPSSYPKNLLTGVVAVSAAGVVAALLTGTPAAASARSGVTHDAVQISAPQLVRLVTGDVVRVATLPDGRQTASIIKQQKTGPGSVFQTFNRGGDMFVVPESAVPYLGTRLDSRLFDVTELAKQPSDSLALSIRLTSSADHNGLPGLVVSQRSHTRVTGTFTAKSALAFGRSLARQAIADHAATTDSSGLFKGIAKISPAAHWRVPVATKPAATLHTLTVKGIDWVGNPDNGDSMTIYNVDDLNLFNSFVTFSGGQAQQQVPNGHYAGVAFFYDFSTGTIYQVTLAQFRVRGDTTVTADARTATSQVSFNTPRPSAPMTSAVEVARVDANGLIGSYSFTAGNQTFYVKPIAKAPSVGTLYYWAYTRNFSTGSPNKPYTYDLKYGSTGTISADQSYSPKGSSLAAIDSSYGADHNGQQSLDARFAAFPWELFLIASDIQFSTPLERIEYYNADPNLVFSGVDYQVYVADPFTLLGEIDSSWRSYDPGYKASQPWGDDPAHPRLLQHNIFLNQVVCPACLDGSTLDALAFPFGDNSEQHRTYSDSAAAGLTESSTWAIKAGKTVVDQGTGVLQAEAPVGSAASYTIAYTTTRKSSDFRLSTADHTIWRIPADAPMAGLPAGWTCTVSGGTSCSVLELMSVDYNLPTNLLGRIASGDAVGKLTVGHLADAQVDVTSLKVKVSYDGGSTFSRVRARKAADGKYTLHFTVPDRSQTNGFGTLRVSAKDANGSTFNETITRAFGVSRR